MDFQYFLKSRTIVGNNKSQPTNCLGLVGNNKSQTKILVGTCCFQQSLSFSKINLHGSYAPRCGSSRSSQHAGETCYHDDAGPYALRNGYSQHCLPPRATLWLHPACWGDMLAPMRQAVAPASMLAEASMRNRHRSMEVHPRSMQF